MPTHTAASRPLFMFELRKKRKKTAIRADMLEGTLKMWHKTIGTLNSEHAHTFPLLSKWSTTKQYRQCHDLN